MEAGAQEKLKRFLKEFLSSERQLPPLKLSLVQEIPDGLLKLNPEPLNSCCFATRQDARAVETARYIEERLTFLTQTLAPLGTATEKPLQWICCQIPDTMLFFRLDGEQWRTVSALARLLDNTAALSSFYIGLYNLLPGTDRLLSALPVATLSNLINTLVKNGGLTADMLVGLAASPGRGVLLRALSRNMREDMKKQQVQRGAASFLWAQESALLFRWNILQLLYRGELDSFPLSNFFSRLKMIVEDLLGAALLNQEPLSAWLARQPDLRALLNQIPERTLVLALAGQSEGVDKVLNRMLPERKIARIRDDAHLACRTAGSLERRAAVFSILKAGSLLRAGRSPFLKRDLIAFLKENRQTGSRLHLLLESGIPVVIDALRVSGEETVEAFIEPMDSGPSLLIKGLVSGRISLKGTGYETSGWKAADRIAREWYALQLLGIWGQSYRSILSPS